MHSFDLILTLTGGLAAALVFGYFAQRAGLSPIVGYLLAGVAAGPHTPGFVADTGLAELLAEVGVILLMFGVGLQFHVEELLAVRRVAIPGAVAHERGGDAARDVADARIRMELVERHRLRHRAVGGEHGGADSRTRRQQRPAYERRTHRRAPGRHPRFRTGSAGAAGMADRREAIRHAKALNPDIHVLARTPYLRDLDSVKHAGAETVISAEGEVGLALTEAILHRLGATPDQIDHERARVRTEFRP